VKRSLLLAVLAVAGCAGSETGAGSETTDASGATRPALAAADSIVADWVDRERVPGAVLFVTRNGEVVHHRAYGAAQLRDFEGRLAQPVAMTTETVFDLASVTKVMATTMAVMLLADRGALDVDAPISTYLGESGDGKDEITAERLLTHTAGLYQWQPTYYHASDADAAFAYIRTLPQAWPVGEGRHYSDLGFMLLGRIVETVSGQSLDEFLAEELYAPLGLKSTGFRPLQWAGPDEPAEARRFAATSLGNPFERRMVHDPDFGYTIEGDPDAWNGWRQRTLSGEVNDGNAYYAFGGVAGHAGLFSTASDLGALVQLLLDGGEHASQQFIRAATIDRFLKEVVDGQALGWQLIDFAPDGSFGHTGFTGTFVLGVPESNLVLVLLTNRQNVGVDEQTNYPDVGPLQRAVTQAVVGQR
jgi:serine-type D-Ala-D-Ala carboxypeptidase